MKKRFLTSVIVTIMLVITLLVPSVVNAAGFTAPEGKLLTTLKEYNIAPGVTEQHITTVEEDGGNQVKSYMATIDPSTESVGILASYKDYDDSGSWGLQTVRDQATAAEKATGKKVVFGINGDYFNMNTGEPLGALVMNGKVVHPCNGEPYFAVLKDGSVDIREASESLDDVEQAVSGPFFLIKDGKIEEWVKSDTGLMPRCAVGITDEGKVVFLEIDGRQAPLSCGMTLYETAQMMEAKGCVEAIYLDGGGSATFASRSEGEDGLTVKNSPSDGVERKVSTAILVYSDAKPTGEFDHAVLTPYEEIYTPGSTVTFTASGVDSSGAGVSLPENGTYALADVEMGTIDAVTGEFVSSGKTGEVVVNYVVDEKVTGSTTIQIQQPDSISFVNEEVALGFEAESTLGLTVQYQNRQINYQDDDFVWTMSDEKLGTFTGNIFKSSDGATVQGTITCKYKDSDVSGSLTVIVGLEPTVMMDFEDYVAEDETVTEAKDYWTFNRAYFEASGGTIIKVWDMDGNELETPNSRLLIGRYADPNTLIDRGGNESASIANLSDEEPVRFGAHSLKLNYDFTQNTNTTDGACVGFSEASQQIAGSPTAVGMYVYAPEGTANLWLRMRVKDGSDIVQTVNFEPTSTEGNADVSGINWTGWKYVEASLTHLQGPFSLIGGETIRPMYVYNTDPTRMYGNKTNTGEDLAKSECYGSIYIDNLQFVYGANTADVDNPLVGNIMANGTVMEEDAVLGSNTISFQINVTDVDNKYTSGVDYSTANVYIDGKNVTDKDFAYDESQDSLFLYNYKLSTGDHTIKVLIRDKAGNETTKTVNFSVTGETAEIPVITTAPQGEYAILGEYADADIKTDKLESVNSLTSVVKLGKLFKDYKVSYGEGFEEAAEPVYNAKNNTVTVSAVKIAGAEISGEGGVVTVSVLIPDTVTAEDKFEYSVISGTYTVPAGEAEETYTFVSKTKRIPIKAKYTIEADKMIAGFDAKIYAYDLEGEPAKDITIYTVDGTEIGTTDLNGTLSTSKFRQAQEIELYGQDAEGKKSFIYKTQSYATGANEDGTPTYIQLNAVKDSETTKSITWMSKPGVSKKKAILKLALKSAYEEKGEEAFESYDGECSLVTFSNRVAYANVVKLTGLKADNEYVYIVGDGRKWSEVNEFRTFYNGQNTKMLIIGDTQASSEEGKTQIKEVLAQATAATKYDLVVQTGDFVEGGSIYTDWNDILNAFDTDSLRAMDMIHVTGNHELYGDDGTIVTKLFNLPSIEHYSVTYGNVYVAVLGYASGAEEVQEYAKWLVSDAAKSNAKWKIVVMHQPPYGTNITDGSSDNVHAYLPAACDQAGIDFVFSGHDHAYARTKPVTNGEVSDDGTVYFICGSTGEKSYSVTERDGYHFAKATNDFQGLYLTVDADESTFKVTAYEKDGSVFDEYTKTEEVCKNGIHTFVSTADGYLECEKCGHARKVGDYTGLVTDEESGIARYLSNGEFLKSQWIANDEDNYYLDKNGFAKTGTAKIDGIQYTFDSTGKFVNGSFVEETVTNPNTGKSKVITRYYTAGGKFAVHWNEINGEMYYFKKTSNNETVYDLGAMYTGDGVTERLVKTVANNQNRYYVFAEDGRLVRGAFETETKEDGTALLRYYWGDTYVTGTYDIQGFKYEFDKNGYMITKDISECDIKVASKVAYTGSALEPKVTVKDGKQTLSSPTNFTYKYTNNKAFGTAKVTITGVPERGYTGKTVVTFKIVPKMSSAKISSSSYNKVKLSWKKVAGATQYRVYRSTDAKNFKYLKTLKGNDNITYTDTKVKTGTKYYYKVRAIAYVKEIYHYGAYCKVLEVTPSLAKVSGVSVKNTASLKAKIAWKAVSGADGYVVERATSKNGTYKAVKTVKGKDIVSYVNSKLTKNKTYYYRVKAYKVVDGKKVYGKVSTAYKVTIKK